MSESIEKFSGFLSLAQEALHSPPAGASRRNLRLVHKATATLAERVSTLEATEEFRTLCHAMKTRLGADGFGSHGWDHSVGNWFRRSGVYQRAAAGEALPDATVLSEDLRRELSRSNSTVTYLALVEYVSFRRTRVDFGRYEITRLSREELDNLLQSQVRADFYPWAVVPTSWLANYWWIVARETQPTTPIGKLMVDFTAMDVVSRTYTRLPRPVEAIVQELALFDWRPDWSSGAPEWLPFNIPLVLRIDDHLTAAPRGPRVDPSALDTEPTFDHETGEEVGERPTIWFSFNDAEATAFEQFVRLEGERLHDALATPWSRPLIEVAARFFAKAFMSGGLEELLWHMATVEALVGEKGEGVTDRLARRLAEALGTSDAHRKEIRKTFRDLYDFRSELVHGVAPSKVVLTRHLFEARQFARRLLRWFIRFLGDVREQVEAAGSCAEVPERKDVLRLLDLESDGVRRARWILPALPATFPRYPEQSD
jgi:hypothetical protein